MGNAVGSGPGPFRPTHVTPLGGLATWAAPDPSEPSAFLDPLLPVRVTEARGDWAHVLCANGWGAWADGRLLIALPDGPPGTGTPPAGTPDPRPLLARLERTLAAYRRLVEELAAGDIDLEAFRERSEGLRVGVVVDGESAWLLDLEHDRWWYCRGTQVQTFATVEAPPGVHGEAAAAGAGAGGAGTAGPGPADAQPARSGRGEPEPVGPEAAGPDSAAVEPTGPEPTGPEPARRPARPAVTPGEGGHPSKPGTNVPAGPPPVPTGAVPTGTAPTGAGPPRAAGER